MNISSIVIQAKPEYVEEIIAVCEANDFCDYHFHDVAKGKIVVTIEGANIDEEMSKMKKIEQIPHVICADMMMAYSENELDEERAKLEHTPAVPAMLNDDTLKAEDIVYRGNLKKKIHQNKLFLQAALVKKQYSYFFISLCYDAFLSMYK